MLSSIHRFGSLEDLLKHLETIDQRKTNERMHLGMSQKNGRIYQVSESVRTVQRLRVRRIISISLPRDIGFEIAPIEAVVSRSVVDHVVGAVTVLLVLRIPFPSVLVLDHLARQHRSRPDMENASRTLSMFLKHRLSAQMEIIAMNPTNRLNFTRLAANNIGFDPREHRQDMDRKAGSFTFSKYQSTRARRFLSNSSHELIAATPSTFDVCCAAAKHCQVRENLFLSSLETLRTPVPPPSPPTRPAAFIVSFANVPSHPLPLLAVHLTGVPSAAHHLSRGMRHEPCKTA
jgi:hypothetical protein